MTSEEFKEKRSLFLDMAFDTFFEFRDAIKAADISDDERKGWFDKIDQQTSHTVDTEEDLNAAVNRLVDLRDNLIDKGILVGWQKVPFSWDNKPFELVNNNNPKVLPF